MAKLYLTTGSPLTDTDLLKIDLVNINASTFPPSKHYHDDLYYTETEVDTKIADVKIGGRNLLKGTSVNLTQHNLTTSDYYKEFGTDLIILFRGSLKAYRALFPTFLWG